MGQMGRRDGLAWKARLGTGGGEPFQTEEGMVRKTGRGFGRNLPPNHLGTTGKRECSKLREEFKVVMARDAQHTRGRACESSVEEPVGDARDRRGPAAQLSNRSGSVTPSASSLPGPAPWPLL